MQVLPSQIQSLLTENLDFLLPVFDTSGHRPPWKYPPCSYFYFLCALNPHPKFGFG